MTEQEVLYNKIKDFPLFEDLSRMDVLFLLEYLDAHLELFEKGRVISQLSKIVNSFALILCGTLELSQYDYWGNRSIILIQEAGDSVALPSTLFEEWTSPAAIFARSGCELLFLESTKLRNPGCIAAPACVQLKINIAKQLALKNVAILNKISLINCRSTREKVSLFLSRKAAVCRSNSFDIEFSRQEMADFLSVDRCALSKELARMKRDGLIEYDRSHFELKSLDLV